jgi:rubrerythrin
MEYKCPCGKMHKSRNTVSRHKKALAQKVIGGNVTQEKKGQEMDIKGHSFLKEINLQGEFDKMTDTINPKKDEQKEAKFKCGACGQTFNERHKRCPHCGVEFE